MFRFLGLKYGSCGEGILVDVFDVAGLEDEAGLEDGSLSEILQNLNDMQRQAVTYFGGPLLILAGAGSGKTTVIVNKIAYLLRCGALVDSKDSFFFTLKPWEILAITFTNKAANELCQRLKSILGDESASKINAGTFHSQCVKILVRHIDLLGYSNNFTIYDTQDCLRLLKKEIFSSLNIDTKIFQYKSVLYEISSAKNNFLTTREYALKFKDDFYKTEVARIYDVYQNYLKNANALDFDDIIFLTVKLLKQYDDILLQYQNKFKYVLVDEYQDTNHVQFELIKLLTAKHSNLCVVGDDDQSIYKFRGAAIENILNFEKHLKNVKTIRLEQNYRSTQNILSAANALIAHNSFRKEKNIWTTKGKGEKIQQVQLLNENEEAEFVCNEIEKNVQNGLSFSSQAVFYRMNAQSATIERLLIKHSIPYQIIGTKKFYELKEIKDAIAYLTVLNNVDDNLRLMRIINEPKRGIGQTTISKLQQISFETNSSIFDVICQAEKFEGLNSKQVQLKAFKELVCYLKSRVGKISLSELLDEVLKETGYFESLKTDERFEQRIENLKELKTSLIQFEQENEVGFSSLADFLSEISLYTDLNDFDSNSDRVSLMSLHAAKGLEFDVVFMVGMEDGIFPNNQSISNEQDLEEERRLAYVGITRARQKLFLISAMQRLIFGSTRYCKSSRFLSEIPIDFKEVHSREVKKVSSYLEKENKFRIRINECKSQKIDVIKAIDFAIDDVVVHAIFGKGKVCSIVPMGNDNLVEIDFDKVGRKKVMANYAKLKKV